MGRQITAAFTAAGWDVVAVARRPAPCVHPHRFLALDAANLTSRQWAQILTAEEVTALVNATLAWGQELIPVNVDLVRRLLDALRTMPRAPRMVQLGTIHEYGPVPPGTAVDETAHPHPRQPYPRSKLRATRLVLDAARAGHVDAAVLRLTNTIGPHPAGESFFGGLAQRLRDDPAAVPELTVADAQRDYLDSRDAADAVVRAAAADTAAGVFNIGSGHARDIKTLVEALVDAAGHPREAVRIRRGAVPSEGADWIRVDSTRAREVLGWRPGYSLEDSMRAMWETVRPHPDDTKTPARG